MTEGNRLATALAHCQEDEVNRLVQEQLDAGASAVDVVALCNEGMAELGNRFAAEECFIPELMVGGMIMKKVMGRLGTALEDVASDTEATGTAVIGAARHDIHDIGKDIVVMMLRGVGFDVVDLGVDVPPERFVEAVREHNAQVVGISVLLTTCFKSIGETVQAIKDAGLRDNVAVMVGGAAASQLLAENTGCDFYGKTAVDGMKYAVETVGK